MTELVPPTEQAPPDQEGLSRRAWIGLLLVPIVFAVIMWAPIPLPLTGGMRAVAALTATMAILWVCESVPLAATALLPLVFLPVFGIAKPAEAAAAYANDLIFLFIGGFVLANGIERWGLHRRLALAILSLVGTSKRLLVGGLMAATAFISLWISNTAAALLMMPIAVSVLAMCQARDGRFFAAMVLGISLAASIGGMGTPIGSTPNLFLVNLAERQYHLTLDFGKWMLMGVPLVAVYTTLAWALLTMALFPLGNSRVEGEPRLFAEQRAALGRWSVGELLVAGVFTATVLGWIFREPKTLGSVTIGLTQVFPGLSDGTIAIAGALALFLIPVSLRPGRFALDWETGGKIPWDIILLFGGGLSLADGIQRTGLDQVLVASLGGLSGVPGWVAVLALCMVAVVLSEVASNTATAALLLPLVGSLAVGLGASPLYLMLPITLAASLGFMLPAATPPNALALATGHVSPAQMALVGAIVNALGLVLIMATTFWIAFPVFGIR